LDGRAKIYSEEIFHFNALVYSYPEHHEDAFETKMKKEKFVDAMIPIDLVLSKHSRYTVHLINNDELVGQPKGLRHDTICRDGIQLIDTLTLCLGCTAPECALKLTYDIEPMRGLWNTARKQVMGQPWIEERLKEFHKDIAYFREEGIALKGLLRSCSQSNAPSRSQSMSQPGSRSQADNYHGGHYQADNYHGGHYQADNYHDGGHYQAHHHNHGHNRGGQPITGHSHQHDLQNIREVPHDASDSVSNIRQNLDSELDQWDKDLIVQHFYRVNDGSDRELAFQLGVKDDYNALKDQPRTIGLRAEIRRLLEMWESTHGSQATVGAMLNALEKTSDQTKKLREQIQRNSK